MKLAGLFFLGGKGGMQGQSDSLVAWWSVFTIISDRRKHGRMMSSKFLLTDTPETRNESGNLLPDSLTTLMNSDPLLKIVSGKN